MDSNSSCSNSDSDIDSEALKKIYSEVLARKKKESTSNFPSTDSHRDRSRSRDINRRGAERVAKERQEK